ncbi:unnamed protein product [Vitrella brassicaformis CCMP3155]|uniref:Uncharacterized protein n=2 Tax=Vitrella brassicaformis TaxID=1169539 RepID=A0A0G4GV52_VITBC|nr:unnamed protein product [Vitrella brassicaformis CCMP3155]|eukprot:CEM34751.1 unnamed protein product [Vitrella brassicaformis CCMP3155]
MDLLTGSLMNLDDKVVYAAQRPGAPGPSHLPSNPSSPLCGPSTHFQEAALTISLVQQIAESAASPDLDTPAPEWLPRACERVTDILARYQESPALLDAHWSALLPPLIEPLSQWVVRAQGWQAGERIRLIGSVLYTCSVVRGHKTIVPFYPSERHYLEPLVALLEGAAAKRGQDDAQNDTWRLEYVLLLWLSLLALLPFQLTDSIADTSQGSHMLQRLVQVTQQYLSSPSRVREAASVLLSKVFSRPDTLPSPATQPGGASQCLFASFVQWAHDRATRRQAINGEAAGPCLSEWNHMSIIGVLQALNETLKRTIVAALSPLVPALYGLVVVECGKMSNPPSLIRKYRLSCSCRIGLVILPQRMAPWRYQHHPTRLLPNVTANRQPHDGGTADGRQGGSVATTAVAVGAEEESADESEHEGLLEDIFDIVLQGLQDSDTIVRWAAAKAVGRLCMQLTQSRAEQVIDWVLEGFGSPPIGSTGSEGWHYGARSTAGGAPAASTLGRTGHGACLAIAELLRRGLLVPCRLPTLVPFITQALLYDVRRGAHTVGAALRDAACYVCWAIARTYPAALLGDAAQTLFTTLVQVAVLDREVNCRRAASAALQEWVGRQSTRVITDHAPPTGPFSRGLEVLTAADYFAIASRSQAYLSVAPTIARLDPGTYGVALVWHLVECKVGHPERSLRELATQALQRLTPIVLQHVHQTVLPYVVSACLLGHLDTETRHGLFLTVAAIIEGSRQQDTGIEAMPSQLQTEVRNLIPKMEKARLYRGKGGEIMRHAACELIATLAGASAWSFKDATAQRYLQTVEDCLKHFNPKIQVAASHALEALATRRLSLDAACGVVERFLDLLSRPDQTVAARRGYLLGVARGAPPVLIQAAPTADGERQRALRTLAATLELLLEECLGLVLPASQYPDLVDAESRRNALLALGSLLETHMAICRQAPERQSSSCRFRVPWPLVFEALLGCLKDYQLDSRGDVGSWVREVAMELLVLALENLSTSIYHDDTMPLCSEEGSTAPAGVAEDTLVRLRVSFIERAVCGLLQQAVEKIDRPRGLACMLLARLYSSSGPAERTMFQMAWSFNRIFSNRSYDDSARTSDTPTSAQHPPPSPASNGTTALGPLPFWADIAAAVAPMTQRAADQDTQDSEEEANNDTEGGADRQEATAMTVGMGNGRLSMSIVLVPWCCPTNTFPHLLPLLRLACTPPYATPDAKKDAEAAVTASVGAVYRHGLVQGLAPSVGGLTEFLAKAAGDALVHVLTTPCRDVSLIDAVSEDLMQLLHDAMPAPLLQRCGAKDKTGQAADAAADGCQRVIKALVAGLSSGGDTASSSASGPASPPRAAGDSRQLLQESLTKGWCNKHGSASSRLITPLIATTAFCISQAAFNPRRGWDALAAAAGRTVLCRDAGRLLRIVGLVGALLSVANTPLISQDSKGTKAAVVRKRKGRDEDGTSTRVDGMSVGSKLRSDGGAGGTVGDALGMHFWSCGVAVGLRLLGHKYPVVRQRAAEELYLHLISLTATATDADAAYGKEHPPAADHQADHPDEPAHAAPMEIDTATELLIQTPWSNENEPAANNGGGAAANRRGKRASAEVPGMESGAAGVGVSEAIVRYVVAADAPCGDENMCSLSYLPAHLADALAKIYCAMGLAAPPALSARGMAAGVEEAMNE